MRFAGKLFGIPSVLIFISINLFFASNEAVEKSSLLFMVKPLRYASISLFAAGLFWIVANLCRVWQAKHGIGENLCEQCSMPTSYEEGRNQHYYRCWSCGCRQNIVNHDSASRSNMFAGISRNADRNGATRLMR